MNIWRPTNTVLDSFANVYIYDFEDRNNKTRDIINYSLTSNMVNSSILDISDYVANVEAEKESELKDLYILLDFNNVELDVLPENYIIVHMHDSDDISPKYLNTLKNAKEILCFSYYDINTLKKKHSLRCSLIPIMSAPDMDKNTGGKSRDIDVLIYGDISEKMKRLIDPFYRAFLKIRNVKSRNDLLKLLPTAKLLLQFNSKPITPPDIELIYNALLNNVLIISEPTWDERFDEDMEDLIIYANDHEISARTLEYVNDSVRNEKLVEISSLWQSSKDGKLVMENYISGLNCYGYLPPVKKSTSLLALASMVKNEVDTIHRTINSTANYVDKFIFLDTGSTDGTQDKIRELAALHNKPLILKEFPFIDFSTNKNILLDTCLDETIYALILDANDELVDGEKLRKFCENNKSDDTCYSLMYNFNNCSYFPATRLIKPGYKWKFAGSVHEIPLNKNDFTRQTLDNIWLKQIKDNPKDIQKSNNRYKTDVKLLLKDLKKNPSDARTVFYIGQSYECCGDHQNAFKYYERRIDMIGYIEEKYMSYYRCARMTQEMGQPWDRSFYYYIKAFECCKRAEPIIQIAKYYKDKDWILAYTYCKMALELPYPSKHVASLFMDPNVYNYERYFLMGIIAYYAASDFAAIDGRSWTETEAFRVGKEASLKAAEATNDPGEKKLNMDNHNFYK